MSKNIIILSPGATKEKYLAFGIENYKKKLNHFSSLKTDFFSAKISSRNSTTVIRKEGSKLVSRIGKYSRPFVVILDQGGKKFSSVAFAAKLETWINQPRDIIFVIGSAFGISNEVKKMAEFKMSLSEMTFIHEMARLLLLEQLYRAFQINQGSAYHK